MKFFLSTLVLSLTSLVLLGCGVGPEEVVMVEPAEEVVAEVVAEEVKGQEDVEAEKKGMFASFEVLPGWEKKYTKSGSAYRGIKYEAPEDSFAHYILFDIRPSIGAEEDARQNASEVTEHNREKGATLEELDYAGERLYISELRTSDAYGGPWWSNILFFEKDGWVFEVEMTDRFQNQKEAIKLLVETVKVEKR